MISLAVTSFDIHQRPGSESITSAANVSFRSTRFFSFSAFLRNSQSVFPFLLSILNIFNELEQFGNSVDVEVLLSVPLQNEASCEQRAPWCLVFSLAPLDRLFKYLSMS